MRNVLSTTAMVDQLEDSQEVKDLYCKTQEHGLAELKRRIEAQKNVDVEFEVRKYVQIMAALVHQ